MNTRMVLRQKQLKSIVKHMEWTEVPLLQLLAPLIIKLKNHVLIVQYLKIHQGILYTHDLHTYVHNYSSFSIAPNFVCVYLCYH